MHFAVLFLSLNGGRALYPSGLQYTDVYLTAIGLGSLWAYYHVQVCSVLKGKTSLSTFRRRGLNAAMGLNILLLSSMPSSGDRMTTLRGALRTRSNHINKVGLGCLRNGNPGEYNVAGETRVRGGGSVVQGDKSFETGNMQQLRLGWVENSLCSAFES